MSMFKLPSIAVLIAVAVLTSACGPVGAPVVQHYIDEASQAQPREPNQDDHNQFQTTARRSRHDMSM